MEPISLSTDYSLDDWRALNAAARMRLYALGGFWQRTLYRAPMFVLVALMVAGATWLQRPNAQLAWVIGIASTLLLFVVQGLLTLRRYRPRRDGRFLGLTGIEIDVSGLHITRRHSEGSVRWPQIIAIDVTPAYVFLWCDTIQAYLLPARDLPAPLTTQTAAERIRGFMAASPAASAIAVAAEPPATTNAATGTAVPGGNAGELPRATVGQELAALVRLLLVRPVDGARIAGRDLTICIVSVILLALWIPLDPLLYADELEFSPYDFPGLVWVAAGALALAWILSRLSRPQVAYRRTLLLVLGALPIAMIGSSANSLTEDRWVYLVIAGASIAALSYLKRGLTAITGTTQVRALLVSAAATFGFVVLSDALYVNPSLWQYSDEDADEDTNSGNVDSDTLARMEELQFGEQARIDTEIAGIRAARERGPQSNTPQVYFLGFAGVGEQRVFAGEIALAEQRVGERYKSTQRSLLLVNDRRDPEKLPLATVPALRHALRELGEVMGPEDVLFLALSSHGSEDVTLEVSNVGMTSTGLSAAQLVDMLKESHIRWKVVVISACYAGGFVDALRDDHTIVLAAAAPDRTSFGCADDRDLTYFGEAFYRDALPRAASLRAAFEAARAAIGKREKQEQFEDSDPEAYFGTAMEAKLAALEPTP